MNQDLKQQFEAIADACQQHLQARGFKRKQHRFLRWKDDTRLFVLGLQQSKHNPITQLSFDFFVNAAVVDPLLARIHFPNLKNTQLTEAYATWSWRIDSPDDHLSQWRLRQDDPVAPTIAALLAGIDSYLPRMEAVPGRAELLHELLERRTVLGGNTLRSAKCAYVLAVDTKDGDALAAARAYLDEVMVECPEFPLAEFLAQASAVAR